eukprot:gene12042-2629_t
MDNLEKTKKKRKSHRGTTTKLLNKVEDALAKEEKDQLRLQQLLADLKDKAEVGRRNLNIMFVRVELTVLNGNNRDKTTFHHTFHHAMEKRGSEASSGRQTPFLQGTAPESLTVCDANDGAFY